MHNSLKYLNSHTQGVITLTMNDVFEIKETITPDTTHLINRNAVLGSLSHYVALITIDRTLLATSSVRTVHSYNKVEWTWRHPDQGVVLVSTAGWVSLNFSGTLRE